MFLYILAALVGLFVFGQISTWTYERVVRPALDKIFPTLDNGSAIAIILGFAAFPFGVYLYKQLHGVDRYVLIPAAIVDVWFLWAMLRPQKRSHQ